MDALAHMGPGIRLFLLFAAENQHGLTAWMPIWKAGKNLVISSCEPEKAEQFFRAIPSTKGVFLSCKVRDKKQADELIRLADTKAKVTAAG